MYSSPGGDITVSSWRTYCILLQSTCCEFLVMLSSRLLPLDKSLLMVPTFQSDFVDPRKCVVFFWTAPLGPISIGGVDVTVALL